MPISQEIKREVLKRDQYKCQNCGRELDLQTAQINHIMPLSKGGTDQPSNLRAVCPKCNMLKVIDIVSTPLSKQLAEVWIWAFGKAPKLTVVTSILVLMIIMGIGFYVGHQQKLKKEIGRKENLTYYTQIEQLDKTERNIKQLLEFIKQQRTQLKVTEDALLSLQSERDRLKPLVESDRKVVEGLFIEQEQRNQAIIHRERWIGFGLGILASVLASAIMLVVKYFIMKRKNA